MRLGCGVFDEGKVTVKGDAVKMVNNSVSLAAYMNTVFRLSSSVFQCFPA